MESGKLKKTAIFLQAELAHLEESGAMKEERELLLKQHEHNMNMLISKMEADRLRMQSNLQGRLKQRQREKMEEKEVELKEEMIEQRRQMDNLQRREMERLKMDEVVSWLFFHYIYVCVYICLEDICLKEMWKIALGRGYDLFRVGVVKSFGWGWGLD